MTIRVVAMTLTFVTLAFTFACGDDSGDTKHAAGSGGSGGAKEPMSQAGRTSAGTGTPTQPGTAAVQCGSTTCQGSGPLAQFLMPCCADAATSTCGMSSLTGAGCMKPVESDPRCPAVDIMGIFKLASCCTTNDRCGIDASMFGMAGCADLQDISSQVPSMGFISFPSPRSCSGTLEDAGAEDAGH
jgi:hypothetical protein